MLVAHIIRAVATLALRLQPSENLVIVGGALAELLDGADGLLLAAAWAGPDVERGPPVTVPGKTPVLNILDPGTETAGADRRRIPVHGVVVSYEVILYGAHLDEPGLPCIVNERGITAPAVWIGVRKLRCVEEELPCRKVLQHLWVRADGTSRDLLLGRLAAHAGKRCFLGHTALLIHKLNEREVVFTTDAGIVLTEGRGDMNDTGTVLCGNIAVRNHEVRTLMLLLCRFLRTVVQWLIVHADEIGALAGFEHLIGWSAVLRKRSEHLVEQAAGHHIGIAIGCLHLRIVEVRVHTETGVRWKGPWRGRPCEEVEILILRLEADNGGALGQLLIALGYLMARKRGAAARAIWDDLKSLVQELLLKDFLQCPPLGLDVIVMIGDIWVLHIGPEADLVGEVLPHALILPDIFLTETDKRRYSVLFNLLLAIDADLLLDFELDRKAVGIPAGLTWHHRTLHRMESRNHVLEGTRLNVANVWFTICRRRPIVEYIGWVTFVLLDGSFEDVILSPELLDFAFALYKVHVCINFFKHQRLFSLKT